MEKKNNVSILISSNSTEIKEKKHSLIPSRKLRFSPFPSSFSNVLRTVRRDLYEELRRHCLVLEGDKHGGYKQNIYVLPYANAPSLMHQIQLQNREIDELNGKIEEFARSSDFQDVHTILQGYDCARLLDRAWTIEHVSFDATPLALNPDAVMEMVRTARSTIAEELKEEERLGMEALQTELQRKSQEIVTKGVEEVQKRIDFVVRKIVGAKKLNQKKVKADLERLRNIAISVGLESIAATVIDPLSVVIENPEKTFELFGSENLSTAVSDRVKALLDAL